MTNYHLTIEELPKIMTDESNKSDPSKKGDTHSFKNSFENVRTSIDYLNRISIPIPIVERSNLANTLKKVVIKE